MVPTERTKGIVDSLRCSCGNHMSGSRNLQLFYTLRFVALSVERAEAMERADVLSHPEGAHDRCLNSRLSRSRHQ